MPPRHDRSAPPDAGASCQRQSQWYHQCLPGSGSGAGWGGSGSGSAGSTLGLWDQCGGKGGDCARFTCEDGAYPGQSCPAGSTCQRLHEWFSQCRPAGTSFGTCEQVMCWLLSPTPCRALLAAPENKRHACNPS